MRRDIGIDIGSKNTYIYAAMHGSVSCEPSAAAVDNVTGTPVALGTEAKRLCMRTPGGNRLVYPLGGGMESDNLDFIARLLGYHTAQNRGSRLFRPKVAVAVSPDITDADEELFTEAVLAAGAAEAVLIEAPLAAAAGAGRDVYSIKPTVVVDAGASKTAAAIIADGKVKHYAVTMTGGNTIDEAIADYMQSKYRLILSHEAAEELKTMYLSLDPKRSDKVAEVTGVGAVSRLPQTVTVRAAELAAVALVPAMGISDLVCQVLDKLTAEYGDQHAAGATVIVGGTANLAGFADFIAAETGVPASVADNPAACTAIGLGIGLG